MKLARRPRRTRGALKPPPPPWYKNPATYLALGTAAIAAGWFWWETRPGPRGSIFT